MKLYVDHEISENSTAFIRWCLSPKEIKHIEKRTSVGDTPMILICVVAVKGEGGSRHDYVNESRLAVPLRNAAAYINFRRSGKHIIYAFVLDDDDYCLKEFMKVCRRLPSGLEYESDPIILRHNRQPEDAAEGSFDLKHQICDSLEDLPQASIEIEVIKKAFAKKPWDFKLVNSYCEYFPLEECSFRKRRMAVWPMLVVWLPLREALCLAFLLSSYFVGCYKLNWRPLNPLNGCSLHEVITSDTSNYFFKSDNVGNLMHPRRLAIFPPIWVIALLVIWLIGLAKLLIILGVLLLIMIPTLLVSLIIYKVVKSLPDNSAEKLRRKKEAEARRLREELQPLLCELVPEEIGLKTLPADRQTIRLRFRELKRRVCKQYEVE